MLLLECTLSAEMFDKPGQEVQRPQSPTKLKKLLEMFPGSPSRGVTVSKREWRGCAFHKPASKCILLAAR